MRVRGRARPGTPLPQPDFPYSNHSPPAGWFMAPTDALTVKLSQMTFFPCHLIPLMIPTPTPLQRHVLP